MTRRSRREVLASISALTVGIAGCTGDERTDATGSPTSSPPTSAGPGTATRPTSTPSRTTQPEVTTARTTTAPEIRTTGPPTAGVTAFDEALVPFMDEWALPGASVAVADQGRLVFARGYGLADREQERPVQPDSLFRIGSISKPITATAVLDLVERDELSLGDRAFDVRPDLLPEDGPADSRVNEITVRQLLRHTSGIPGRRDGFLPMFEPAKIAREQGFTPPADAETTIRYVLGRELAADPGTRFAYANVGYCILGRVLEGVVGRSYEAHVRDRILNPLGADRMQVGGTRESQLLEDEVRYYGHQQVESPFPGVGEVSRPYAAAALRANDADGGWIGSPVDLLRFVEGVDGRERVPDVLDEDTIETMTARPALSRWEGADQYHGMGWYVIPGSEKPTLWYSGSLPGSYAFLIHDGDSDRTVAVAFNSRAPDLQFQQFNGAAQRTVIQAASRVSEWPDRDLFDEYS